MSHYLTLHRKQTPLWPLAAVLLVPVEVEVEEAAAAGMAVEEIGICMYLTRSYRRKYYSAIQHWQ